MGNICGSNKVETTEDMPEAKIESGNAGALPPQIQPRPATALPNVDEDGEEILRILLLGAAESGKTTLLEQIRMVHKQNFTEFELIHRRAFIYNNIMNSMKAIILNAQKNEYQLLPENESKARIVLSDADECLGRLTNEEYDAVQSLWQDPAIQEAYTHRGEYNLNDSAKYFFEALERINMPDFQPTSSDLIRAYVPTIGIQNIVFNAKKRIFQLFDLGGKKVDRRKWATMYDGLDAIFFCSAISEYDQKFEDDEEMSRLMDSLNLLEQICNEPKFANTPIFIFLNELDVLKEKLVTFPLADYFSDYTGTTEKEALEYLKRTVQDCCHSHPNNLFVEYICAVDNEAMAKVLDQVFKKLLQLVK